ncbi:MAG: hypothetical protein E7223_03115 [Clostridiales bacterium]|nr:hypothetical protein [Clostridiales bacterium]
MTGKKTSLAYKIIKFFVWLFYPKCTVEGAENLPEEPCIIVGNHAQMNGPIACELYFPGKRYIWCAGEMMHLKEVPAYAYQDFWSKKPKRSRWFYKLLSYIIAPFSACIFNNANTVPVYHDTRIMATFKSSLKHLEEGASLVIFPEHDEPGNHILCRFQDKFVDTARMYYKRSGKALVFVPLYVAPELKKLVIGKPVQYRPEEPIAEERARICGEIHAAITELAAAQPRHRVVPYKNVPGKFYPYNV